ncbi:MAG: ABC transporter permease [Candidatus Acidiferrales bacterium]
MDFKDVLRVALRALARNKMRTLLTMLGIIIGVAAVICTVAIGAGASNQVQQAINSMGANMIWVEAGGRNVNGVRTGNFGTKSLWLDDVMAIRKQITLVSNVSPNVDGHTQVVYGNLNWFTQYRGVSPEYLVVRAWKVETGSMFGQQEIDTAANVCVLGQTVVDQLFPGQDPVEKTIRISHFPCQVIGVLAVKGQSAFGQDQDDTILMPYTTVMKKIKGNNWLDDLMCTANSADVLPAAETQITQLLRQRHHLRSDEPDDFNLRHPADIAQANAEATTVMELLLASIGSVALVVGGIGIMNIMLVSVTERTREIGVRLAVGATEVDVRRQFLSEAVVLSTIGGLGGIALGFGGSGLVPTLLGWPVQVSPTAVIIALIFSVAVGIFFGYYPARQASRLDPIEALRYE